MDLFKTVGRKLSPNQLQLRLTCHILSTLGRKCFRGRICSTSEIRFIPTKHFLFSPWGTVLLLAYTHTNHLAIDKFTWKYVVAAHATPPTFCVTSDHSRIAVLPNVTFWASLRQLNIISQIDVARHRESKNSQIYQNINLLFMREKLSHQRENNLKF